MADFDLTPRENARLDAVTSKLISDAAAENLVITREMLENLPAVRMAVLTDLGLDPGAMDEVRRLVPDQVRKNEIARQLADGNSDLQKEISRLSPARRMLIGHDQMAQITASAPPPPVMSAEEEASKILALRQIAHPATRLTLARNWGLA